MRARSDFAKVKLTAAGEAQVGEGGELRVSNRHMHYAFQPGVAQEVVRAYEWHKVLRHELTLSGQPLFELVEEETPADAPVETADEVENSEEEVSANASV
jgi:hypothetical protein